MCRNIRGAWHCSAVVQFWYGRSLDDTTPASRFWREWWYDGARWGPLAEVRPVEGEMVGIFVAAGDLRLRRFTREQLLEEFYGSEDPSRSAVATMVTQALVRARVYADEHARAAVLQAAVLPSNPEPIPGIDFGVNYEPADVAQGLGGDWYDVLELRRKLVYLAVGDVVGHGLPAVEDMAQLRSAGRALALQGLPPAQLLAELNTFTRRASHGQFATMSIAVYNPVSGSLDYASAGHPPALLRRSGPDDRAESAALTFSDLSLDPVTREVTRGSRSISLTRTEFALLEVFLQHPRQVLSRTQIFDQVWGYDFGPTSNSLGVYIGYLRRKTESGGEPRLLHTARGVGYALRES